MDLNIDGLSNPPLSAEFQRSIEKTCHRGENILWSGQPDTGSMLRSGRLLYAASWLFAMPIVVFLTMEAAKNYLHPPLVSHQNPLYGLIFMGVVCCFVGLLLLSPLWIYLISKNSLYVLTDERAISICLWPIKLITSYLIKEMDNLQIRNAANGLCDLNFTERKWSGSNINYTSMNGSTDIGFLQIDQDAAQKLYSYLEDKVSSKSFPSEFRHMSKGQLGLTGNDDLLTPTKQASLGDIIKIGLAIFKNRDNIQFQKNIQIKKMGLLNKDENKKSDL